MIYDAPLLHAARAMDFTCLVDAGAELYDAVRPRCPARSVSIMR